MLDNISQNQHCSKPILFKSNPKMIDDNTFIPTPQVLTKEYVSSETNSASKAYGLMLVRPERKFFPQTSLSGLVNYLDKLGLKVGKDYEIDSSCIVAGNTNLTINDSKGNKKFEIYYVGENQDEWTCYIEYEYKDGKITKEIFRNKNNEIEEITNIYPQEKLKHLVDKFGKTPEEYLKCLKEDNVKFEVSNDNMCKDIVELDENGSRRAIMTYNTFGEDDNFLQKHYIARREYDNKGNIARVLQFCNDEVRITNFLKTK